MDLITLALAGINGEGESGGGVELSTDIASDGAVNTKAATPAAVRSFVEGKGYLTREAAGTYFPERGEVQQALNAKQPLLNWDNAPTANSPHAVKSGAVYSAIQSAITAAFAGITEFSYYKCGEGEYDPNTLVPTVQNPDSQHIYLVPDDDDYLEYAYVNSAWDLIGTTSVDLSGYATLEDLEDYTKTEDLPAVPTKVSELENDAGFITKPRTVYFSYTPASETDTGPGVVGGCDHVYVAETTITEEQYNAIAAAAAVGSGLVITREDLPAAVEVSGGTYNLTANVKPTETGASSGSDIDDPTKPFYQVAGIANGDDYGIIVASSEHVAGKTIQLFVGGDYLTEHQSLAAYTPTSGFANVAFTGKYTDLSNKPTIPVISTNINNDAGSDAKTVSPKAVKTFVEGKGYLMQHQSLNNVNAVKVNGYKITVETEAPDAGTPDTTITIVVPE